jgi:hypothetical protein
MSPEPLDIIDLIDNALDDCLSPDAMRWTPAAPDEVAPWLGATGWMSYDSGEGFTIIDEEYTWTREMAEEFSRLLAEVWNELEPPSLGSALTPVQRAEVLDMPPVRLASAAMYASGSFDVPDEWPAVRLRVAYDPSIMFPGLDQDAATERLREALGIPEDRS